jgi:signal transduction histidine kinase
MMTERLASLGQMASGVAHEINNPLASIAGCTEALRNRVRNNRCETATCEEYFTIILDEIRRCKNITTSMLSFVRTSSYEKKEIVLHELIDKTIEMMGFQGRLADVEIVRDYAGATPLFSVNEGELRQVLLIILTNALDAMEDRGTLEITTRVREESVVLKIADSGGGIPEQDIKKIFDPFFTTKSHRGGTGLGLSIAHKIILNHGGAIHVSSRGEQGSDFTIDLPFRHKPDAKNLGEDRPDAGACSPVDGT